MSRTPEDRQKYIEEFRASLEEGERLVRGRGRLVGPILMEAEGIDGQLLFLEHGVRIKRREKTDYLARGLKADKLIPFSQISGIQLKKAERFTNGYIQFSLLGRNEAKDVTRDENTLMFRAVQQRAFEGIKTAIETKMSATKTTSPRVALPTLPYIDELEKLASLRDRGIITEEEFAAKKRQILGI
jgi:hypothetical protein